MLNSLSACGRRHGGILQRMDIRSSAMSSSSMIIKSWARTWLSELWNRFSLQCFHSSCSLMCHSILLLRDPTRNEKCNILSYSPSLLVVIGVAFDVLQYIYLSLFIEQWVKIVTWFLKLQTTTLSVSHMLKNWVMLILTFFSTNRLKQMCCSTSNAAPSYH